LLFLPCRVKTSYILELCCIQNAAKISYNITMHCIIYQYCKASHRHVSSTLTLAKSSSSFFGNIKKNSLVRTLTSFNQGLGLRFWNQGFNWILKCKYLKSCTFNQCIFLHLYKIYFTIYQKMLYLINVWIYYYFCILIHKTY
jgi:hypothetical protein